MMKLQTKNIIIVGVGGQGIVFLTKLLALVLHQQEYEVKVSEIHGMSQRKGSVVTNIRYGEKVFAPTIELGNADYMIALETIELLRFYPYLSSDGKIFWNKCVVDIEGEQKDYIGMVNKKRVVRSIDGKIENANIVLYGIIVKYLGISKHVSYEILKKAYTKKNYHEVLDLFEQAYNSMNEEE